MKKHYNQLLQAATLLAILLFTNCTKEDIPTEATIAEIAPKFEVAALGTNQDFQTRTPGLFNYNLEGNLVHNYVLGPASLFSIDDNQFANTKKLPAKTGLSLLVVQGFGFNIPSNARIDNIYVKVRRFKQGKGSVNEYFSHLVRKRERLPEWWEAYGPRWADPNYFPSEEGEVSYTETGSGINGGGGSQVYEWTPDMINHRQFGFLSQTKAPTGSSVVIYYDQVEITVVFTLL